MALVAQAPSVVRVGRVAVVHWPGDGGAAMALAEMADRSTAWPGISAPARFPMRLILAPNQVIFDSVTAGRLPPWGSGAAFPGTNTIVLILDGSVHQVLRHELAHLALRSAVRRVPLWFDEGYASRAAQEWGRLDALRVNWSLVRGRVPGFVALNRDLRAGATRSTAAYALATTTVVLLERLGGERGLAPLITSLGTTSDFDQALRRTYAITLDQFEAMWRKDIRRRYGWLLLATSFSVFWTVVGGMVVFIWARRRRRDRIRRAALDEGWVVPTEEQGGPS
jgi:hypothetical protein